MSTLFFSPTIIARQFLFVREVPQNKGQRVEAIQKWCGGAIGDSWCAEFVTMVLDICFQGNSPIPRLRAVQDIYNLATKNGWMTDNPQKDDLYIYVDVVNHAHHVGIFTENWNGIAGNTSVDGTSSNGSGVFEHSLTSNRSVIKFIHFLR
jgi:hypothetical protein